MLLCLCARKRCVLKLDEKNVRDVDKRIWIRRELHIQGTWYLKDLAPALFKLESSLSEEDRRDLRRVCEERQWKRYAGSVPPK